MRDFLFASYELSLMRDDEFFRIAVVPVVDQVGYDLLYGIRPDVGKEYEVLVLVIPHEYVGFTQRTSYVVSEFVDVIVELGVGLAARGSKSEQHLTCVDVMPDYVSHDIAVDRGERFLVELQSHILNGSLAEDLGYGADVQCACSFLIVCLIVIESVAVLAVLLDGIESLIGQFEK